LGHFPRNWRAFRPLLLRPQRTDHARLSKCPRASEALGPSEYRPLHATP
jgi:hypothetical protein